MRRVGPKPTNNVRQYSTAVIAVKGATNGTKPASQFRQDKSSCAASQTRNVPHSVYVIYQTYTPNLAFSLGCVYSHPSLWLDNASVGSFNPFSTTESACRHLEIISHQPPICVSSMFPASDVVTNLQLCSHAEMNHFKSKLSDWTSYYFQGPIGFSHLPFGIDRCNYYNLKLTFCVYSGRLFSVVYLLFCPDVLILFKVGICCISFLCDHVCNKQKIIIK